MTKQDALDGNAVALHKLGNEIFYNKEGVLKAMEEYAKYCASKTRDYYLREATKILKHEMDNFTDWDEWWSEFQRKEETK